MSSLLAMIQCTAMIHNFNVTLCEVPPPSAATSLTWETASFIAHIGQGLAYMDPDVREDVHAELEDNAVTVAAVGGNGEILATAGYIDRGEGSGHLRGIAVAPEVGANEPGDASYRAMAGLVIEHAETKAAANGLEALVTHVMTEDEILTLGSLGYKPLDSKATTFYKILSS